MTTAAEVLRIEIDGATASADDLRAAALGGFGHFTAMQVRSRRVRGLRQHLGRLDAANRELFGTPINDRAVVQYISHALGEDTADASVRVYMHETSAAPATMVTVRPPGTMPPGPWRLRSVPYQRSIAHIKHTGDFGQRYYQRRAHESGFDEALLTGPDTIISEGSITNVGCYDGTRVIWPAAPALAGITMQLIQPALADAGLRSVSAQIRLADLPAFAGVFVTNARGIAPVGQIDDVALPVHEALMRALTECYDALAWDEI